jgi:WD40 repeat protein
VNQAAFSADGTLLATCCLHHVSEGGTYDIHVWSVPDRRVVARLAGHEHQVHALAFGPGNAWLASASLDRTVRIWSLDSNHPGPRQLQVLTPENLDCYRLQTLSDGTLLAFRDGVLEVRREGREVLEWSVPDAWPGTWDISPDERTVAGSDHFQQVCVWSLEDGRLLQRYSAPIDRPEVVPGPLAKEIQATAGVRLWRWAGGPYLLQGDGPRGWITPLALSADRREMVIPGESGAALIELGPPLRVLCRMPFEGRLRASLVLPDRVLMVNSAGTVFRFTRPAG